MKIKLFLLLVFTISFLAMFPTNARADGIIIPDPPICETEPCPPPPCFGPLPCPIPLPMSQLVIRYHRVTVRIEDQIAVTHVDQVFFNPNDWPVEGIYVFPLPLDAAVSDFILWVDGNPVEGEVLDADQARQTYEEIVMNLKDPALLEYADRGAVRARIFPIPPQGERRIELEYTQALTAEGGLVRYIYPLSTEKFSALPLEEVSISVEVRSDQPIRAVYSPSHPVAVNREDDFHVRAGYEEQNVLPDTDFALYYSIGETQAIHMLTYRNPEYPADPDGFFLLLLAPGTRQAARIVPKDVLLVLDRSGSMDGEKFLQAQEALRYILQRLNSEDRFNIISFSTGVETYANDLRPASEVNEAMPWVDGLRAEGSTDINRALLESIALAEVERPTYLIFLTDGLPTEGVTDSDQILENISAEAPNNLSLFAFGVGYDVDTFLLDSLAQSHHGSSTYVFPGERLDEILSTFYAKISTPVLTNLSLDFGKVATYDLYPDPLPDLFLGSQIVVVGRYRGSGKTDVALHGEIDGESQVYVYEHQTFSLDSRGQSGSITTLPRLWATRKVGYLLNRLRLNGPDQETIDQIVRLSIRFGIVTPYTSYLVTEPMPLGDAEQDRIATEQLNQMQAMPAAPAYGQEAVEKAARQGFLAGADAVAAPPVEAAQRVRIHGARTFIYYDGLWIDTTFDPETTRAVEVAFLSDDYFALAESSPELASAFALGPAVIVLSDGIAYQVVPAGTSVEPIDIPLPSTAEPSVDNPLASPDEVSEPETTETPDGASSSPCWGGLLPAVPLMLVAVRRRRRVLNYRDYL
jgi:Ca-activated chloride channel family protein